MTVSGYSHVAVSVTDLDAARDFYCDVLGFEVLPRPDFGFPGLWLRVGELQLHLGLGSPSQAPASAPPVGKAAGSAGVVDEAPSPGPGFPHFALYVPTENFDATIDAVRAAGTKTLGEPSSRVDFGRTVHAAFITDPSGNVIELTDVGPLSPG
jgi:catechol 2,3-dioxygenase-like lactoylglutathione lyase family enzyme